MSTLRLPLPLIGLAAFAAGAGAFRLRSTDVFWHLAAGRLILGHRQLPAGDPFRFTSGEARWIDHEWLFQILIRGVELIAGVPALVLFRLVLVMVLALVLALGIRRLGAPIPETVVITTVALLGARPRFLLRPEPLTFIALAVLFILLRGFVRHPGSRTVAPLIVLVAVWVNLHGEAILAPAVAGLYLLGSRLQPFLGSLASTEEHSPQPVSWAAVLGLPAALATALLINPYGWHILSVGPGITGALSGLAAYNPEWVPAWVAPQPFLLAGLLALSVLVAAVGRKARWCHGPTLLAVAGLAALAVSAVRHQALFFVAGAFLAGETVAGWRRLPHPSWDRRRATAAATSLALSALLWCLLPPSSGPLRPRQGKFTPGFGIEPDRFPERAADFLERHPEIGPLFNSFAHGGYLLWRLYPPRQVFHDGRMELQPDLLREIGEARASNRDWAAFLRHHGASGALVRIDPRLRPSLRFNAGSGQMELEGYRTASALLFPADTYALVYWDDLVMLFLDRSRPQPESLMAGEFVFVQPEDVRYTLSRAAADSAYLAGALREVRRKLVGDPHNRLARSLLERLEEVARRRRSMENQPPAFGLPAGSR